MNQIIHIQKNPETNHQYNKKFNIEISNEIAEIPYDEGISLLNYSDRLQTLKKNVYKRKYQLQFIFSSLIAILFIIILFLKLYQNSQNEKVSKELLDNYQLTTLYPDNLETKPIDLNLIKDPFVIGMININKIQLSYPILSETTDELLKISLCRFSGPMPNKNR